jgi:hypothetical protein
MKNYNLGKGHTRVPNQAPTKYNSESWSIDLTCSMNHLGQYTHCSHWAMGLTVQVSIPGRDTRFFSSLKKHADHLWDSPSFLHNVCQVFFPRSKEAKIWSCISPIHFHGMHRSNLTFCSVNHRSIQEAFYTDSPLRYYWLLYLTF